MRPAMISPEMRCAVLDRGELGAALRRVSSQKQGRPYSPDLPLPRIGARDVIVLWSERSTRPCGIVCAESDRQELFNWATTF